MQRPKTLSEAMQRGIDFVALNDEPGDLDARTIREYISVVALSEAFGYSTRFIAIKVRQARLRALGG